MGGERTGQQAIDRAGDFYRHIGMRPLHARVEIPGYISDRLQQVLFHEALYMVRDGVCTPAEIDAAITGGPGRRWAFMGPMLAFHLAGGEGGRSAPRDAALEPKRSQSLDALAGARLYPRID